MSEFDIDMNPPAGPIGEPQPTAFAAEPETPIAAAKPDAGLSGTDGFGAAPTVIPTATQDTPATLPPSPAASPDTTMPQPVWTSGSVSVSSNPFCTAAMNIDAGTEAAVARVAQSLEKLSEALARLPFAVYAGR